MILAADGGGGAIKPASKRSGGASRNRPPNGGDVSLDEWRILDSVSQRVGHNLQVQQGGHNPAGDPTSKGTHDGGGAVDLFIKGMSPQEQLNTVAELRSEGAIAWLRTPEYGWNDPNDEHIHVIFPDDPDLSPVALRQVEQYNAGQNGLANHAPDPFKNLKVTPVSAAKSTQAPAPAPAPYDPLSSLRPPTTTPPSTVDLSNPSLGPTTTPPSTVDLSNPNLGPTTTPPSTVDLSNPNLGPTTTPPSTVDLSNPSLGPTTTPPSTVDLSNPSLGLRQPTPAPGPVATPTKNMAPAPVPNASGYGWTTPTVPAEALPAPMPGATDIDRAKAAGQNPVASLEPSQRTAYEVDFLKSLGWTMPKDSPLIPGPQKPSEMYSPNSLTDMAAYTYQVDQAERDRITAKYRNVEGFVPPSDTQGLPNPDITPFEADVTTAELTWEAYDKLSNEARTAVDLNGLLVAARELDLSKEYKLEGDELNEYNKRTTALFGKPDTSTKVAPNVVRLLTTVNWSAVGQDLDEYLSLERGFTLDELQDLDTQDIDFEKLKVTESSQTTDSGSGYNTGGSTPGTPVSNFNVVRSEENMAAMDAALASVAGKRFDEVMANSEFNLWDLPSSMNLAMSGGARPTGKAVPFGYGEQTDRTSDQGKAKETFYQSAYNYLADAGNTDLQPLWDEMTTMNFTTQDTKEFWQFVDDRTRKERRWGQVGSPYGESGRTYKSADEIRALVGLEG